MENFPNTGYSLPPFYAIIVIYIPSTYVENLKIQLIIIKLFIYK